MDTPRASDPPFRTKLVAGVQWAITVAYVFLLGVLVFTWYLDATRTPVSFDASRAFAVVVIAAFLAGYLRVALRPRSEAATARAHARRVEVVLALLVLGFVLPFGASLVGERLGREALPLPLVEYVVAYAANLALSYGVVYGLDARPFFGHASTDLEE